MKNQALFSLKDKSKKLKCRLLQFLFGNKMVKVEFSLLKLFQNPDLSASAAKFHLIAQVCHFGID